MKNCKSCEKNTVCEKSTHIENYRVPGCMDYVDADDVRLAEAMFSKRELAELYVKKLNELERLKTQVKTCPWCGQLL